MLAEFQKQMDTTRSCTSINPWDESYYAGLLKARTYGLNAGVRLRARILLSSSLFEEWLGNSCWLSGWCKYRSIVVTFELESGFDLFKWNFEAQVHRVSELCVWNELLFGRWIVEIHVLQFVDEAGCGILLSCRTMHWSLENNVPFFIWSYVWASTFSSWRSMASSRTKDVPATFFWGISVHDFITWARR